MDWIVELLKQYGLGVTVFIYFIYRFNEQNKLIDKERGELKARIAELEKKDDQLNLYVRTELTTLLDSNRKSLDTMNKTIETQTSGYLELQKIIRELSFQKK